MLISTQDNTQSINNQISQIKVCSDPRRNIIFVYVSAGKPATQESSLDVFCHVIFDVNIDVMDVRGRPQEFVAL